MADEDWTTTTLGEICPFKYGKGLPATKRNVSGSVRVYGSNGVVGNHSVAVTGGPTVVIGRKGSVGAVHFSPRPCWPIDTTFYIEATDEVSARYIYYLLKTVGLEHMNSDSAVPGLNRDAAHARAISVPSSATERRAIASVLASLDDKIELNRRMAQTLEEMARALFKSWFVDFDPVRAKAEGRDPGLPRAIVDLFQDRLVDSELGEIPEGWSVRAIGDLATVEKGLSYKGAALVTEGGVPMINLGCFGGEGAFRAENLKRYSGEFKMRHLVHAGDLLLANTDMTQRRTILGSPVIASGAAGGERYLFTHHTYALRFKPGEGCWRRYLYFALLSPRFRRIAEGYSTGTTVLAMPRDAVLAYRTVFPSHEVLAAFVRVAEPIAARVAQIRMQVQALEAIRDALLPKLVSGELRLPDPEGLLARLEAVT